MIVLEMMCSLQFDVKIHYYWITDSMLHVLDSSMRRSKTKKNRGRGVGGGGGGGIFLVI